MHNEWSIISILEWTARYFKSKGIAEPRLEAEVLMSYVLKKDRVYLYAHFDAPVSGDERKALREIIRERAGGKPSAYITGSKEFMSLCFKITPAVLIPRPDTEVLVEEVIRLAGDKRGLKICDVGTGSGIIALSLAHYLKEPLVYATDVSAAAAAIAAENARLHNYRLVIEEGSLLQPFAGEKFDFITANLPYINEEEYLRLSREVKGYEPQAALLAGGDGLDYYRELIPQAFESLVPGGYLLFEIGHDQGPEALKLAGGYANPRIIKDYAGRDRVIAAGRGM